MASGLLEKHPCPCQSLPDKQGILTLPQVTPKPNPGVQPAGQRAQAGRLPGGITEAAHVPLSKFFTAQRNMKSATERRKETGSAREKALGDLPGG